MGTQRPCRFKSCFPHLRSKDLRRSAVSPFVFFGSQIGGKSVAVGPLRGNSRARLLILPKGCSAALATVGRCSSAIQGSLAATPYA